MPKYQNVAFLFPGQGAQYAGMAKDFVATFSVAKQIFEEADDTLGRKLSTIILQGPDEILTETKNSQTGIFVASMAILSVLQTNLPSLHPSVCAGLSLGEYTAIAASKRLAFAESLLLVQHRGHYMNDACESIKGTMAVILGLDGSAVEEIVRSVNMPNDLWTANFNCPGQVVISGTLKGVEAGSIAAKSKGAKRVLPIPVHGAFHSGLMQPAGTKLAEHIQQAHFLDSSVQLVMNVPGKYVNDSSLMREYLIQQVTHPVYWEKGIKNMEEKGVDLYVEVGCGKTLAGFNKRIGVKAPTISIEKVEDLELLSKEIG